MTTGTSGRSEKEQERTRDGSRVPLAQQRRGSMTVASTARTATSPTVPGVCRVSSDARVRAVKAAMSPNGTKMTRVTAKTRTKPIPISDIDRTARNAVDRENGRDLCIHGGPRCPGPRSLRNIFPRAVFEFHQYETALIRTVGFARLEIVDRQRARSGTGATPRILGPTRSQPDPTAIHTDRGPRGMRGIS